jgi:8-oxo-dGTP pyrophosphatase MutT (NUDIX family)
MTNPPPHPLIEAAGLLLFVSDNAHSQPRRFLLMRHADRWDLPKGHCEPGETLLETALRETHEETGIPRSAIEVDDQFSFSLEYIVTYRDKPNQPMQKRVTYFLGRLDTELPISCTEHAGYQWFDWMPPHRIQTQTIDPLLASVETHVAHHAGDPRSRTP